MNSQRGRIGAAIVKRSARFFQREQSDEELLSMEDSYSEHIKGQTKDAKSIGRYRLFIAMIALLYSTSPYLVIFYLLCYDKTDLLKTYHDSLIWLIVSFVSSSTVLMTIMLSGVFRGRPSDLVAKGIGYAAQNSTGN